MARKKRVKKNSAAIELGRRGGLKRFGNMTPEEKSEFGRKGAEAYWKKFPERRKQKDNPDEKEGEPCKATLSKTSCRMRISSIPRVFTG